MIKNVLSNLELLKKVFHPQNLRKFTSKRQKKVQPGSFLLKRAQFVYASLLAVFIILGIRATVIQLFPSSAHSLSRIADKQYKRSLTLSRYRGTILDRRGEPLAISIRMPSLFINPKLFTPSKEQLRKIVTLLSIDQRHLKKITNKKKYFAWLKRKVPKGQAEKVMALGIKGLYQVMEPARYYPAGMAAANLLGYVGLDDKGLSGIERQLEAPLAGAPIRIFQDKDAKGNTIFLQSQDAAPEKTGDSVYLTIDKALQEIAESALRKGVKEARAAGGFAIVSDPHTGKLLAVANEPSFDPNNPALLNILQTKNRALMDVFEPGSIAKTLVAAGIFKRSLANESTLYDCENGRLRVGKDFINDSHKPPKPMLNVEETVVHSSNVCIYKIARDLGRNNLYDMFKDFGIGERLNQLGFPGEAFGSISAWKDWKEIRFANISFGQGLMVTGLDIVQAYGAIANGGNLIKPYYIDRIEGSKEDLKFSASPTVVRRVISPSVAKRLRNILSKVVENGATKAQLENYTAAGKTGTAQKIDPLTKRYSHAKHLASFVGFAPSQDPYLVIYIQIDEPRHEQNYGALWAAPVFKEIAERSLSYLNVAKDKSTVASKSNISHDKKEPTAVSL